MKGKGKAAFNPECAPFVPSSLKTESTPKLSPLSQPFTPPEIKIEQRLTPPHKRLPIKKISSTEAIFQKSLDLASTSGNESPPNSVSKSQSPLNAIKAEDESREAEDKASSISAAPKLPPHLRGLSAKTSTQLSHPVPAPEVTAALQLVDPFCDAVPATEKENETMQNWLDTLEQGIKVSAEPSQFDPMPGSSDKLIDLDSGETGEASNTAAVPGWTEVALPTPVKKRLTLEEFDKDIRDHVERLLNDAPEGKERLAVLKELLVMLRACLAESRAKQSMSAAPEDEGYHTANPVDPHLNGHEQGDIGATEQPTHPTSINTDEAQSDAATLSSLASKWNHINENDGTVGIVMEVSAQMDKVSRSGKYGKAAKSKKNTADETRCEMDDYLDPVSLTRVFFPCYTLT